MATPTQSSVDTSQFNAMCQSLAQAVCQPLGDVVRSEVGKILETALRYTPAINVGETRARSANALYTTQPATLYQPKHGRKNVKLTKNGFVRYFLKNRYPTALWDSIKAKRKERLARILAARGLAKQSWLKLARALGVQIAAPGYVSAAVPGTGRTYSDTSVTQQQGPSDFTVTIDNSQPTINKIKGAGILQRAINSRVEFFLNGMRRGTFTTIQRVAAAYPGMKITP